MDISSLSTLVATPGFWAAVGQIILIDILLGGDNAVVIALACRKLPEAKRRLGILWGVVGAIGMRIALIFFALQLLNLPYLKLVGGLLLLWIGIKLLLPDDEDHAVVVESATVLQAVKTILIADTVMSVDNVIGVAGAAGGEMVLVVFGILVSVPIIVWGSRFVLWLMDRYPVVIVFGGGLLGWIAGGMMVTDQALAPWLAQMLAPSERSALTWLASLVGALMVVLTGKWMAGRIQRRAHVTVHAITDGQ